MILYLFIFPVIKLFILSFSYNNHFSILNYLKVLESKRTWMVLKNTVIVCVMSTLFSAILGVGFSFITLKWELKFRNMIERLIILPLMIPSYVIAISWIQMIGSNGMIPQIIYAITKQRIQVNLYSIEGIILLMSIAHFPIIFLLTSEGLKRIPKDLEWAAKMAGVKNKIIFFPRQ